MTASRSTWHDTVFFGIHYDLHARANDTELGKELTHEHLRERLLRVKPDWIQCDCKGHAGYTSWPTKIGSPSPGVVKDALRIHRDVTRELGIPLGMHYSGVWDDRATELHPEWARIDENGKPDPTRTCRIRGYTEQLMIPQMLEVIDNYDVDGFWVDGDNWAACPCWCEKCKAEFIRRTGIQEIPTKADQSSWLQWLVFHRNLFTEYVTKYTGAVHARKPECLVCSNWMYTVRQPDPVTAPVDYLSGDYDFVWGSNRAAIEGRLLDGRGLSWDLMAWTFIQNCFWALPPEQQKASASPWTTKTLVHLCQEVSEVLALGGAIMLYDQPQRSGWLTGWHQDLIGKVARFCRERKDVCFKTQTVPQAAILHLADHYYAFNSPLFNYGTAVHPLEGALHALLEAHLSTDILTEESGASRLNDYKLIVVPEQTHLSPAILSALEAFGRAGGQILMTGGHLAKECPALVGVSDQDEPTPDVAYLPVGDQAVGMMGPWGMFSPAPGTKTLTYRLSQQDLEKNQTNFPAVTRRAIGKGAVIAVHGSIFKTYFLGHYPLLRSFLTDLIATLNIPWTVTVQAPPRLELVLRQNNGKLLINLINRGAGEMLSPQRVIVEELPPVENVVLQVRQDTRPRSVTMVPDDSPIAWTYEDGMIRIDITRIAIHNVIVIG